jgi:pimeloyl-ACP methyl ester carboxylesterase
MAKATIARGVKEEPRVGRGYFECRYGQLHVHNAIPPGGGFEEATALLCVHQGAASGRTFARFLSAVGRDRSVYAPDLPGCGESDGPPVRPSIADYAAALGDFLDSMRFRQIDVLGHRAGSLIAAELAVVRPQQVRRVVMAGVPVFSEGEREGLKRSPWPVAPAEDGSHLAVEWRRLVETRGAGANLQSTARSVAERLHNGPNASWSVTAAAHYPVAERLVEIRQPVMVLRPRDDLWEATARVRELLPRARYQELPDQGQSLFESAPDVVAAALKDFLSG